MNNLIYNPPRFFTVAEVAARLSLCTKTVINMIRTKQLPAHRIGRQYRIAESDLASYLKASKH